MPIKSSFRKKRPKKPSVPSGLQRAIREVFTGKKHAQPKSYGDIFNKIKREHPDWDKKMIDKAAQREWHKQFKYD